MTVLGLFYFSPWQVQMKIKIRNKVKQPKWTDFKMAFKQPSSCSQVSLVKWAVWMGGWGGEFRRGIYCTEEKVISYSKKHNKLLNIFRGSCTS